MTRPLRMRIKYAEFEVSMAKRRLQVKEDELSKLNDSRVYCKHIFAPAALNYEHEGGYCTECGINELYAKTLASWAKTA